VSFLNDCVGAEVNEAVQSSSNGKVFLLENLRFHIEEEGKAVDKDGNKIKVYPFFKFRLTKAKLLSSVSH
jgi:phosphoglycerate kinase